MDDIPRSNLRKNIENIVSVKHNSDSFWLIVFCLGPFALLYVSKGLIEQRFGMFCFSLFLSGIPFAYWVYYTRKYYADNINCVEDDDRYYPCPYSDCGKMMFVIADWDCPKCGNTQGKQSLITDKCTRCPTRLDKAVCEHCLREFYL